MADLVRIIAPDFVAGAVLDGERIERAAPILWSRLKWHRLPRSRAGLRELVRRRRWKAELLA